MNTLQKNYFQAITTKVFPSTNTKGTRIKATCSRGSITIPYDHSLHLYDAHVKAAQALVSEFLKDNIASGESPERKSVWNNEMITGINTNGTLSHVFMYE